MLHEGLGEGKAGLQAVVHRPNECLVEVRVGFSRRVTFRDGVQVVIDRKEAPCLGITFDAMGDGFENQCERHARGCVLFGHRLATVAVSRVAPKASAFVSMASGIESSINDLVTGIGVALGREIETQSIDRRDIDNIRRLVVSIEKARRMLRWSPQTTLAHGLERTRDRIVVRG